MAFPNSQSNPQSATPVWIASPSWAGATPKNITTNVGTLVKTGPGVFQGLSVNTAGTTSTATVYDGIDNTGTKIGTYSTTAQGGPNLPLAGISFTTGLYVVTAGAAAADITVSFS